jgi:hypothetical protein
MPNRILWIFHTNGSESTPLPASAVLAVGPRIMRRLVLSLLCLALVGCGQSLSRSDKPVSREAASKDISVPLPDSAKDVYYVIHSGGMHEFQLFVRFTVEPKDMDKAVDNIVLDYDKRGRKQGAYESVPVMNGMRWAQISGIATALLPMPWWDTDSITNGYYRGPANEFGNIHIWTDATHHQIYLCIHD